MWLAFGLALMLSATSVQATNYVYDANGRLVVVTNDDGESARYVYDVMGNIIRIERVEASELRIFAMTPSHGTVETLVSIRGQGFSSQLSDNTVLFNGATATVASATANELKVTVPFGATTGPVTVAVGTRSTTSDAPFVVDDTGLPPVIGEVSPDIAVAGDTLSVSGSHLYPIPGKTSLRLDSRSLDVGPASNNVALSALVSPSASSGHISVQTPYGLAEGLQTVMVVPPGISPASIASKGVATLDATAATLTIADTTHQAALLFDNAGQSWITLQFSNVSIPSSGLKYSVYAPGNTLLFQGLFYSGGQASIHLPRLSGTGTYLVLFSVSEGGASFTAGVQGAAKVSDAVTTLSAEGTSQSVRGTFSARAGDTLALKIVGATTSPANANVGYEVRTPGGVAYTWGYFAGAGGLNMPAITEAGTWQVIAWPGLGYTGNVQVAVVKGLVGTLPPDGDFQHFDAATSKQNAYLDFEASALGNYELAIANATLEGTSNTAYDVNVYGPAGNQVTSTSCYTSSPGGGCGIHLWYLSPGRYSVIVSPVYDGRLHFDAALRTHLKGRSLPLDQIVNINLSAGQAERFTFAGTTGQTVAIQVASAATTPAGQGTRILIYRPDAGAIMRGTGAYVDVTAGTSGTINLPNLPVSGNYTVIVLPDYGLADAVQLAVVSGAAKTVVADGDVAHLAATVDRQNIYIDFDAEPNRPYELTFSNITLTGSAYPQFYVTVYDNVGRQITSDSCTTQGCELHLWRLPPGHYRAEVTPNYGGILGFDVSFRSHVTGRVIARDIPLHFDLATGLAEEIGFDAEAGDTVALQVANIASDGGRGVRFLLYSPDVGAIMNTTRAYSDFTSASSQLINLPNLPSTGHYTLLVLPVGGSAATGDVTMVSGSAGEQGAGDTSGTYETHVSGQTSYIQFTAEANEDLELTLANLSQTGSAYPQFYVDVYDSAGRYIRGDGCASNNVGASCQLHLWKLAAGRYTLQVQANYGGTLHFDALIRHLGAGPTLQREVPAHVVLQQGQPTQMTFDAAAGETVVLHVEGATTHPAGATIRYIVYRPDVGPIVAATPAYSDFQVGDSGVVNLTNLPVSGKYRIYMLPSYGLAAEATLTVMNGVAAAMQSGAAAVHFETRLNGQNGYGSITVGPTQNVELTLSNLELVGASTPAFSVYVYDLAGRQVATQTCYTSYPGSSCEVHLWGFAAGKYNFIIWPNYGGTLSLDAIVRAHAQGPALSSGVSTGFALGTGQVERFTINANAGDTLELQASEVIPAAMGAGVRFIVYRPDAGYLTTATTAIGDFTTGQAQTISVPNLPVAGAYVILVLPDYGLAASGKLRATVSAGNASPIHQATNLPLDGAKHAFASTGESKDVTLTFDATLGDNLQITLADELQDGGKGGYFYVQVYDPSGLNIDNYYCYPVDPACARSLWNLATGTYSVVARPTGSTLAFNVVGRPNTVKGALTPGVAVDITRGLGEALRYTFHGDQGSTVLLRLSDLASTPAGFYTNVLVYRPDGGKIVESNPYTSFYSRDHLSLNLSNLPASGDYFVIVGGDEGLPQAGTLTLFNAQADTTVSVSHPNHFASSAAGQNLYMQVDTGTGGDFELNLHTLTGTGGSYYYVSLYDPDGINVDNIYCYLADPACNLHLWNARGGIYTAVAQPVDGMAVAFDVSLTRDVDRGVLQVGTPADTTHGLGEVLRYRFHADQGQSLALRLDNATTSTAGYSTSVLIYRPDGGLIQGNNSFSSMYSRDTHLVGLTNLPVSGDYIVVVASDAGLGGSGSLSLVNGVTGSTVSADTSQHLQANTLGQNIYFNVDTGAGGNFELVLSGAGGAGRSSYSYVSIYDANGVNVDNFYCYFSDPACTRDFWTKSGVYTVIVQPQSDDQIHFDASLVRHREAGSMILGQPLDISHGLGEFTRARFHAEQGETVALRLSNLVSTPAGYNTGISVFRPDGGLIVSGVPYSSLYSTNGLTLNLPSLPVSGDYTVVASTDYGLAGKGNLTVVEGVTGSVVSETTVQHIATSVGAQTASIDVDVGPGGNLEFVVENVKIVGTTNNYFQMFVYDPKGINIANYYCYSTDPACIQDWWNMSPGTYRVSMVPAGDQMLSFDASVTRNLELGPMTYGVPKDLTHGRMQVARTSFDASIGDTVRLTFDDIVADTASRYTTISVYRPDVGLITLGNAYARTNDSTVKTLTLPNLPVGGTYIVMIGTDWGVSAQGHITAEKVSP